MQRTNTVICCYDRPIDCGLLTKDYCSKVRNIPCSVNISIGLRSTTNTMEPTTVTIMAVDEAAFVTPLTGVSRVNHHDGFTCSLSFLRDELPQLIERPAMQPPVKVTAFTFLVPYAAKVFKRKGVEVCGDDFLADTMIAVEVVPSLSQPQTTKMPFTAVSACLLQPATKEHYLSTDSFVVGSTEKDAITQCADITLSHVDTENVGWNFNCWSFSFGDKIKRDVFVGNAKRARLDGPAHVLSEVRGDVDAVTFPSTDSAKADSLAVKVRRERSLVVTDTATKFFGCDSSEFVSFERFDCNITSSLNERRIQLRPMSTSGLIAFLVQQVFATGMQSQSFTDMKVATTIESLDSIEQFLMFRQTKLDSTLHAHTAEGELFKYIDDNNYFMDIAKTSSSTNKIGFHIVWCPKYRKKLSKEIETSLKIIIEDITKSKSWKIQALEINSDHIHLFIQVGINNSPIDIVKSLKGISSRMLFEKHPELRNQFYGGHLWSPSYYISSVGHISDSTVKKYIEEQKIRSTRKITKSIILATSPPPFEKGGLRRRRIL